MRLRGHRLPLPVSVFILVFVTTLLPGCATQARSDLSNSPNHLGTYTQPAVQGSYVVVDSSSYDASAENVTLRVHAVTPIGVFHRKTPVGEQVIDVSTNHGPTNYATSVYPSKRIKTVRLLYPHHTVRTLQVPSTLTSPDTDTRTSVAVPFKGQDALPALSGSRLPRGASRSGHVPIPPPGARVDHRIHWRVKQTAPTWMKENAVVNEARSKLGTPYIWGHSEDRGQYGFDCSNFTAYVYHHALGYKFTGASRGQARYVGVRVPISDMRRGDLIIFEHGKHVGICVGKRRMIQEGGGLGKVGYLSLGPRSYWGKHITSIKRLI